jgi:uncharacterized protein (TIGR02996 family)
MARMMAIVKKTEFDRVARGARLGDVLPLHQYVSANPALAPVAGGGALYLVTVRPPDERLWLVAVLEAPVQAGGVWRAENRTPATDVSSLRARIRFTSGAGISAKAGALGMSLQTPRALTDEDVALLDAAAGRGRAVPRTASTAEKPPVARTSATAEKSPVAGTKGAPGKPPVAGTKGAPEKPPVARTRATAEKSPAERSLPTGVPALLARARDALAADELPAALAALVAAWRERRVPAIGDAAWLVDERLRQPVTGDWLAAARAPDPQQLGALAASLVAPKLGETQARVEALARWPPDPRSGHALVEMLRALPFTSDSSKPAWQAVHDAVRALGDPRVLVHAESLPSTWKVRELIRGWFERRWQETVSAVRARFPDGVPALDGDEQALLDDLTARLRTAPATGTGDELLAAVYAALDSDEPRLIYADWLQERGDARGELIALQCQAQITPAQSRRLKQLLDENGRAWLGPLEPVIAKTGVVFRRGFLAGAHVMWKSEKNVAALGTHPSWCTVEAIELGGATYSSDMAQRRAQQFIPPTARSLKRLGGLDGDGMITLLSAQQPWAIEELSGHVGLEEELRDTPDGERSIAELVQRTKLLPRLRKLTLIWVSGSPAWLEKASFWRQLEELEVGRVHHQTGSGVWLAAAARHPKLARITIDDRVFPLTAERDGAGARWRCRVSVPGDGKPASVATSLSQIIAIVGKELASAQLVLAPRGKPPWQPSAEERNAVEKAAATAGIDELVIEA